LTTEPAGGFPGLPPLLVSCPKVDLPHRGNPRM
jgi:hypothetical protein